MGQAKQRGTREQRVAQAIAAGHPSTTQRTGRVRSALNVRAILAAVLQSARVWR